MESKQMLPTAPPPDHGPMPTTAMHQMNAPPTYNEAMGWTPQAGAPVQQVPQPAQGHRPLMNTSGQPGQPPVVQPILIVQQPQVVMVGPKPVKIDCPACHASIKTTTITSNKVSSHLCALLLCIFGCWPCFWIPYCMESCKQVTHSCPNCKSILGTYNG